MRIKFRAIILIRDHDFDRHLQPRVQIAMPIRYLRQIRAVQNVRERKPGNVQRHAARRELM